MKERPILFSGPMVRAILEGRKTQTRRVVADRLLWRVMPPEHESFQLDLRILCPYGAPGDRLWVEEALRRSDFLHTIEYSLDGAKCTDPNATDNLDGFSLWRWKRPVLPAMYMPRWASRLTLEVKAVRVERLQEISEADARAEGIRLVTKDGTVNKFCVYDRGDYSSTPWSEMPRDAVSSYRSLWDSINAKRGHGWETNPWVWVVEFERVEGDR